MNVFAIDGSTLRLPDSSAIRQEFGTAKNEQGERPMARVSMLHDVLNRVTYDAAISPYKTSEQDMAWQHLEEATLPDGSLILLDRGYNNFALLRTIRDQGHHFCIRLRGDLKIAKVFKQSGKKEMIALFEPTKTALSHASPDSPFRNAIKVRLVRMALGTEEYVLMTSLADSEECPRIELFDLYHQRWQVEESYKVKKCRMKIEELSGKTPELVRQDFHAKIFAETLTMALAVELDSAVEGYSLTTKNEYQISITQALAKMKNTLVLLFIKQDPLKILNDLLQILMKSLVAMVPGRKFKRKGQGRNPPKLQTQSFGYRCNR